MKDIAFSSPTIGIDSSPNTESTFWIYVAGFWSA